MRMQTYIPFPIYTHAILYVYSHFRAPFASTDRPAAVPLAHSSFHIWQGTRADQHIRTSVYILELG